MAVFDLELQRVCVRVVYDGPAYAGKTTNVRQLAAMFPSRNGAEVISPSELHGRTLSFDWLQIAAGAVAGFPLICQVISVPGQSALTARRRHLLETADVVVYVCDSSPQQIERAQQSLGLLDRIDRERPQLVLQANKQDQREALRGSALAQALGLEGVHVVEAIAVDGAGVVDTFVSAVRAISRDIQARIEKGEVRIPVRRADTADGLLGRLSLEALEPEAAAELLLQEVQASMSAPIVLEKPVPIAEAPSELLDPVLPSPNVPPGHVWPAHTGRALLESLSGRAPASRTVEDDRVIVRIGDYVLSTSGRLRFRDGETARTAIVRAARERSQLGDLLAPETVLVLQPADDGSCWLWTIRREMQTCARALESDASMPDRLGRATAELLRIAVKNQLAVELSTRAFAIDETIRYVGDLDAGSDPLSGLDRFLAELEGLSARDAFASALRSSLSGWPEGEHLVREQLA
jgi:signal recognition particle receptor subunit beta